MLNEELNQVNDLAKISDEEEIKLQIGRLEMGTKDEQEEIVKLKKKLVDIQMKKERESVKEWGLELGPMSWDEGEIEIAKLNSNLKEGEKPWRFPARYELVDKFNETRTTPEGFKSSEYWSDTTDNDDLAVRVQVVNMADGSETGVIKSYKGDENHPYIYIRLVR